MTWSAFHDFGKSFPSSSSSSSSHNNASSSTRAFHQQSRRRQQAPVATTTTATSTPVTTPDSGQADPISMSNIACSNTSYFDLKPVSVGGNSTSLSGIEADASSAHRPHQNPVVDKALPWTPPASTGEGSRSSSSGSSSSGTTTPASSQSHCRALPAAAAATSSPLAIHTALDSPAAGSDREVLLSPPLLSTTSPTPVPSPSPHRSIFHFHSTDSLRQPSSSAFSSTPSSPTSRPTLLRSTSELNSTTAAAVLLMQRQQQQHTLYGAGATVAGSDSPSLSSTAMSSTSNSVNNLYALAGHNQAAAATTTLTSAPIKRSQSLPPQLFFRDSIVPDDDDANGGGGAPLEFRSELPALARRLSDVALDDKFTPARLAKARAGERRYRALLELVETEEAYLQDLCILNDVFFNALNFTPLHPSARDVIRRNIEDLLQWHQSLHTAFHAVDQSLGWRVSDLAASEAKWDDRKVLLAIEQVMHMFRQRAQGLHLYESFCAQHSDAASLLRQHESSKHTWDVYIEHCNTILDARFPQAAVGPRLTLYDYLIKPVQRICRYPLMLSQLKSFLDPALSEEAPAAQSVEQALDVVRGAAAAVDAAKMLLVSQRRTRSVASRMEMPPSTRPAFLGILGQVSLAGALYFTEIPNSVDGHIRVKYFGCFLYDSHLVIVKVKRQDSYEPRHWFPLRAFQIEALPEGEGLLPYSLRLRHGSRVFELAATCAQERDLWVHRLQETAAIRKRTWLEAIFHNPVAQPYDDFVISSVAIEPEALPSSPSKEVSLPTTSTSKPPSLRQNLSSSSLNSLPGRSRFSAANILGKSTTNMRDAIDLRLADVFSDTLLVARVSGEEEHAHVPRPSLLMGNFRPKAGQHQNTQLARRGTTRDIQQRKSTILENSAPFLNRDPASDKPLNGALRHQRRSSADAECTPMGGASTTQSPPAPLQRSKTNPSKPRASDATPQLQTPNPRRSWAGSIRRRTSSWMGAQPPPASLNTLEQQVSVARNDSSSSSGSSRDLVRTPSPMSSAPPSPMVQPADSPQLREMPLAPMPRRAATCGLPAGYGSPEQDFQAMQASKYLYENGDTASKSGWMSSVRGKRAPAPGLSLKGRHQRSNSSMSLLSLFTPALSPTAPSPLGEEGPHGEETPPVSPTSAASSSSDVPLAELGLAHASSVSSASPASMSAPPPKLASLRRSKSKRFTSIFPLTRLTSSGGHSTGGTSNSTYAGSDSVPSSI